MSLQAKFMHSYGDLAEKLMAALDLLLSAPHADYEAHVQSVADQYVERVLDVFRTTGTVVSPSIVRYLSLDLVTSYQGPLDVRSCWMAVDSIGDAFDRAAWRAMTTRFPNLSAIPVSPRSDISFWTVFSCIGEVAKVRNPAVGDQIEIDEDIPDIIHALTSASLLNSFLTNLESFIAGFPNEAGGHRYKSRILEIIEMLSVVDSTIPDDMKDRSQAIRQRAEALARVTGVDIKKRVLN